MDKAIQRVQVSTVPPAYSYRERTTDDEFDSSGQLRSHEDEVYEAVLRDGTPSLKLVELNGRKLSPAEALRREQKEQAEEQKLRGKDAGMEDARPQSLLTPDLVRRYQFTLLGTEMLHGRETYRLAFVPRPGLPVRHLTDRFFNHIAGTVWIDAAEFELARAEIHLTSEVKLWDGILAAIKRCDFRLDQIRLPDGTWLNQSVNGFFEGRKFLSSSRVKISCDATDFRLQAPQPAVAKPERQSFSSRAESVRN